MTAFTTAPACSRATHESTSALREFAEAALDLKNVMRQGWIEKAGIARPESVADHSYATSIITMALADADGRLDAGRAIRMALLHDLAECITGDITPGRMSRDEKDALERKAMDSILDRLPEPLRGTYDDIWQEYLERKTPESILVHDADHLEMVLQAGRYADRMSAGTLDAFLESGRRGVSGGRAAGIVREALGG